MELGETEARIKRIIESTKGICHRELKEDVKCCFLFDSWFVSNRTEEYVINVGADMIFTVKTNKMILQVYHREAEKKLSSRFLSCVEEKVYGDQG